MTRTQKALGLTLLGMVATVVCLGLFAGVHVLGEAASARVVDHVHTTSETGRRMCWPVLEYAYDGETIRERSILSSGHCPEIGEEVEVAFWPGDPRSPSPRTPGAFLPLAVPLLLFGAAAWVWVRRARGSELSAEADKSTVASATDGALVRLRGRLELAHEAKALTAPLTGRECVAWWTRVVRREPGEADRRVADDSRSVALVVVTESGEVRVAADTPLRLAIDADARGDDEMEASAELEGFLTERGCAATADGLGAFHVWYQGIFAAGEEVCVVGRAQRVSPAAIVLTGTQREEVVLEHADREERRRRMPTS